MKLSTLGIYEKRKLMADSRLFNIFLMMKLLIMGLLVLQDSEQFLNPKASLNGV